MSESLTIEREIHFGHQARGRKELLAELFRHFDWIGNGTIDRIQVKNGLPFMLVVSGMPT